MVELNAKNFGGTNKGLFNKLSEEDDETQAIVSEGLLYD